MTKEENIATLIEHLDHWKRLLSEKICDQDEGEKTIDALQNAIKALEQEPRWIPVKWHEITDEEREREGYPKDWITIFDCMMPEDEQEILITVKDRKGRLWVEKDTCYIDDGFYLDSGYDWIEDVVAWSKLPEPYKEDGE